MLDFDIKSVNQRALKEYSKRLRDYAEGKKMKIRFDMSQDAALKESKWALDMAAYLAAYVPPKPGPWTDYNSFFKQEQKEVLCRALLAYQRCMSEMDFELDGKSGLDISYSDAKNEGEILRKSLSFNKCLD